jgi:hypothetical protein
MAFGLSLIAASVVVLSQGASALMRLRDPGIAVAAGVLLAMPAMVPMLPYLQLSARQPDVWRWQVDLLGLVGVSTPFMIAPWHGFGPPGELFFLPMLQASWFILPALVNAPWDALRTRRVAALALVIAVFGLLAITPGVWMFRWMFRLLPFYHLACILLGVACVEAAVSRDRRWKLLPTLAVVALPVWMEAWQSPGVFGVASIIGLSMVAVASGVISIQQRAPRAFPVALVGGHALAFLLTAAIYLAATHPPPNGWQAYEHRLPQTEPALTRYSIYPMNARARDPKFWRLYEPGNLPLESPGIAVQGYSPFDIRAYQRSFCTAHIGQTECPDIVRRISTPLPGSGLTPLDLTRTDEVRIAQPDIADRFAARFADWRRRPLADGGAAFRRTKPFGWPPPIAWASPGLELRPLESGSDLVSLSVHNATSRPARVILARAWYPGWRARLNGKPLPCRSIDDLAVEVEAPPGAQGVLRVSYWPTGLTAGLLAAAAAAVFLALLAMLDVRRERRRRLAPSLPQAA